MSAGKFVSKVLEDSVMKQVASLALLGTSQNEIGRQLNITPHMVRRYQQSDQYKELLKTTADEAVANSKNILRARAEQLLAKTYKAIEELLDSGSGKNKAEGVKAVFRLIGVEKDDQGAGHASFVINMPGASQPAVIEVENENESKGD